VSAGTDLVSAGVEFWYWVREGTCPKSRRTGCEGWPCWTEESFLGVLPDPHKGVRRPVESVSGVMRSRAPDPDPVLLRQLSIDVRCAGATVLARVSSSYYAAEGVCSFESSSSTAGSENRSHARNRLPYKLGECPQVTNHNVTTSIRQQGAVRMRYDASARTRVPERPIPLQGASG